MQKKETKIPKIPKTPKTPKIPKTKPAKSPLKTRAIKSSLPKKSSEKILVEKTPLVNTSTSKIDILRTSPKDVFLHLLMLVMLYIGVISLISLVFVYVDYIYPDPLTYYYGSGLLSDIRWQSSMLIVSFPLLLVLAHFIQKDLRNNPKKHELRFYKWLTYLTLFVAAMTVVIDLIQLVNRFYGGELTTPFILKVLWVLLVAGAVFGYYIWDVQTESYKSKVPSRVAWITSIGVIGMVVLGFILAGSPSHQREVRMDEQRTTDLSSIQAEITYYWQNKRELPSSLSDLENDMSYFYAPVDPETRQAYEYKVLEPLRFELCATFNGKNQIEDNATSTVMAPSYDYKYPGYQSEVWNHEAGRHCFQRTIDPDLYPDPNAVQDPVQE